MVWVTVPTPSVLSEWVQARERDPSMELALVREAVLERASRVILAEGTGREQGEDRQILQTNNKKQTHKQAVREVDVREMWGVHANAED